MWDAIKHQVPALIVVVPLLGGTIAALVGQRTRGWWIAIITSLLVLGCSVQILLEAVFSGPREIVYLMGNWPPPFGIAYIIDPLNASVLFVLALIGVLVTLYARKSIASEIPANKLSFFYGMWLYCQTGLLGITITGDAFNLYVLLEISSIATYALVAMGRGRHRRALTSAMNYLLLGTIGASFILIGIGYLYMVTGTLNMTDMSERLHQIYLTWQTETPLYRRTVLTGFAFLMVGVSLKLALVPLHTWLPNAYTYAPSAVTALLAATATKVGAYVSIRFIYSVMGADFAFRAGLPTDVVLMISAGAAILFGSFYAIKQVNLKKLLAYSSLAQIGYIALGFALENKNGLAASVIHLFNHALIKGGMFMALGVLIYRVGSEHIDDIRGLGRKLPITMACFTIGGLGLIGVPLTAGFISKWYLVVATIEAGRYELAGIVLVGSLLALVYVWRVIEAIYFGKRPDSVETSVPDVKLKEAPITMLVPMVLLIGGSIYFGIDASTSGMVAETAAEFLMGLSR